MGIGSVGADGGGMPAVGGGFDAGGMDGGFTQPAAAGGDNDAGGLRNMFARDTFECGSGG
jgi:hypothetical protein